MSEAVELIQALACMPDHWRRLGPGQVVLRLPPERREVLATLRSEDLRNLRYDAVWPGVVRDRRADQ